MPGDAVVEGDELPIVTNSFFKALEKFGSDVTLRQLGVWSAAEALDVVAAAARRFRFHYAELGGVAFERDTARPNFFNPSWVSTILNKAVERWERESGSSLAARTLQGFAEASAQQQAVVHDNVNRSGYRFDLERVDAASPALRAFRAYTSRRNAEHAQYLYERVGRVANQKVAEGLKRFEAALASAVTVPSIHEYLGEKLTPFAEGKFIEALERASPDVRLAVARGLVGTRRAYWKGFLKRNEGLFI